MTERKKVIQKESNEKIQCLNCNTNKLTSNFYVNTNPLFSSDKLGVCKSCITNYIGEKGSNGYVNRVQTVLALMNKPFDHELWMLRGEDWNRYIPQLSSLPQYRGKTFEDSVFSGKTSNLTLDDLEDEEDAYSAEDIKELMLFWGKGLDIEDYIFLQEEYEKFINYYDSDSYATQLLFQEAAQQRLTIKKLRADNKSVDKELKTLQDLLGSANVKPVQETGANAIEQASFGTLLKKYENERPVPDPDEEWKDVDGIGKYIRTWFFGHLTRMMGIKNEYTEEYDKEIENYTVRLQEYEEENDE